MDFCQVCHCKIDTLSDTFIEFTVITHNIKGIKQSVTQTKMGKVCEKCTDNLKGN